MVPGWTRWGEAQLCGVALPSTLTPGGAPGGGGGGVFLLGSLASPSVGHVTGVVDPAAAAPAPPAGHSPAALPHAGFRGGPAGSLVTATSTAAAAPSPTTATATATFSPPLALESATGTGASPPPSAAAALLPPASALLAAGLRGDADDLAYDGRCASDAAAAGAASAPPDPLVELPASEAAAADLPSAAPGPGLAFTIELHGAVTGRQGVADGAATCSTKEAALGVRPGRGTPRFPAVRSAPGCSRGFRV